MEKMRSYENVLREMLDVVKSRVAEAMERGESSRQTISDVSGERAASNQELKGIKKSFSFFNWLKAKRSSGISAEEARREAERYGKYAEVVDQITDEERRLEDARMALAKAEEDTGKRAMVQQKVEELMDVLGLIE